MVEDGENGRRKVRKDRFKSQLVFWLKYFLRRFTKTQIKLVWQWKPKYSSRKLTKVKRREKRKERSNSKNKNITRKKNQKTVNWVICCENNSQMLEGCIFLFCFVYEEIVRVVCVFENNYLMFKKEDGAVGMVEEERKNGQHNKIVTN